MADVAISGMTGAGALDGTEKMELTQSGSTVAGTVAAIRDFGIAPIVTESTTARTALPTHAGDYTRFTNSGAKTYTFDAAQVYPVKSVFSGRNVGSADLTLAVANSFVLNAPPGGSLVVPQHASFIVKIVASGIADVTVIGGASAGGSSIITPDSIPVSPNALDDEFNGVSLNTSTKWTALVNGSTVNAMAGGALTFGFTSGNGNVGYFQSVPSSPWSIAAKFGSTTQASCVNPSLTLRNSANGRETIFCTLANGNMTVQEQTHTSTTATPTFSSSQYSVNLQAYFGGSSDARYYRIDFDGTTVSWWGSATGHPNSYFRFITRAAASWLTSFDLIGLTSQNAVTTTNGFGAVDWFRRLA